jgi:hypothetical protein
MGEEKYPLQSLREQNVHIVSKFASQLIDEIQSGYSIREGIGYIEITGARAIEFSLQVPDSADISSQVMIPCISTLKAIADPKNKTLGILLKVENKRPTPNYPSLVLLHKTQFSKKDGTYQTDAEETPYLFVNDSYQGSGLGTGIVGEIDNVRAAVYAQFKSLLNLDEVVINMKDTTSGKQDEWTSRRMEEKGIPMQGRLSKRVIRV